MAVMNGFSLLLRNGGNIIELITFAGAEMKERRNKDAQFIFIQCKKVGYAWKEERFYRRIVDEIDIDDYKL